MAGDTQSADGAEAIDDSAVARGDGGSAAWTLLTREGAEVRATRGHLISTLIGKRPENRVVRPTVDYGRP
jgi:hypothetical protein